MDSFDERSMTRVGQVCMRLRLHLKQVHFMMVRLVAVHTKGESGGEVEKIEDTKVS